MPIYNYKCLSCKKDFESIEEVGTDLSYCPDCGMIGKRDITPVLTNFVLLGSGWARDGYCTKEQKKLINKELIDSGREQEII